MPNEMRVHRDCQVCCDIDKCEDDRCDQGARAAGQGRRSDWRDGRAKWRWLHCHHHWRSWIIWWWIEFFSGLFVFVFLFFELIIVLFFFFIDVCWCCETTVVTCRLVECDECDDIRNESFIGVWRRCCLVGRRRNRHQCCFDALNSLNEKKNLFFRFLKIVKKIIELKQNNNWTLCNRLKFQQVIFYYCLSIRFRLTADRRLAWRFLRCLCRCDSYYRSLRILT